MCVTRAEFWDGVKSECKEAHGKAESYDTCRRALLLEQRQVSHCKGQLDTLLGVDAMRALAVERAIRAEESRVSKTTVILIALGSLVAGGAIGFGLSLGL